MRKVEYKNELLAIIHKKDDWKEGLDFLTRDEDYLQAGTWWYQEGQNLKAHIHIENKREIPVTQEAVIVMNGKLEIYLYGSEKNIVHTETLDAGDMAVMLGGGHGYKILSNDTKVIEVKGGQFTSVEKDKVLI
jgi:hypothetical protein